MGQREVPEHRGVGHRYFESGETPHTFLLRMMDYARSHIPAEHSKYVAVMSEDVDDLLEFVQERKAVEISLGLPFPLSFPVHETDWIEKDREGLWKFGSKSPVYVGNFHYFHVQYTDLYISRQTYIFAPSKEIALAFLEHYSEAKWNRNHVCPCVLDYDGARIREFRKMAWEDIFMPGDTVQSIKNEIETFFKSEEKYAKHNLDWKRGIMLAGRPGNGKTAICQAIAGSCSVPVVYCMLDNNEVFDILNSLRYTMKANAPCCVIIEDADTLGGDLAVRSALLNLLDGLFTTPGVLTIASTNAPERLDEAFTGRPSRFDSFYIIGDPGAPERIKILKRKIGKVGKISDSEYNRLADNMAGLSAAFVQEVAACALLESFRTGRAVAYDLLAKSLEKVKEHIRQSERTTSDGVKQSKAPMGF